MKKKYKILMSTVIILIIAIIIIFVLQNIIPKQQEVNILETIEGFSYALSDVDTELYKENYDELKEELAKDEIDKKNYAELISKLFIIDLYTINNKVNKYDVGGAEFMHSAYVDNYKLNVSDTIYKYISNEAKKNLPEVSSIEVKSSEESEFIILIDEEETVTPSYKLSLTWTYEKDYGYPVSAVIDIIEENDKMVIVSVNGEA